MYKMTTNIHDDIVRIDESKLTSDTNVLEFSFTPGFNKKELFVLYDTGSGIPKDNHPEIMDIIINDYISSEDFLSAMFISVNSGTKIIHGTKSDELRSTLYSLHEDDTDYNVGFLIDFLNEIFKTRKSHAPIVILIVYSGINRTISSKQIIEKLTKLNINIQPYCAEFHTIGVGNAHEVHILEQLANMGTATGSYSYAPGHKHIPIILSSILPRIKQPRYACILEDPNSKYVRSKMDMTDSGVMPNYIYGVFEGSYKLHLNTGFGKKVYETTRHSTTLKSHCTLEHKFKLVHLRLKSLNVFLNNITKKDHFDPAFKIIEYCNNLLEQTKDDLLRFVDWDTEFKIRKELERVNSELFDIQRLCAIPTDDDTPTIAGSLIQSVMEDSMGHHTEESASTYQFDKSVTYHHLEEIYEGFNSFTLQQQFNILRNYIYYRQLVDNYKSALIRAKSRDPNDPDSGLPREEIYKVFDFLHNKDVVVKNIFSDEIETIIKELSDQYELRIFKNSVELELVGGNESLPNFALSMKTCCMIRAIELTFTDDSINPDPETKFIIDSELYDARKYIFQLILGDKKLDRCKLMLPIYQDDLHWMVAKHWIKLISYFNIAIGGSMYDGFELDTQGIENPIVANIKTFPFRLLTDIHTRYYIDQSNEYNLEIIMKTCQEIVKTYPELFEFEKTNFEKYVTNNLYPDRVRIVSNKIFLAIVLSGLLAGEFRKFQNNEEAYEFCLHLIEEEMRRLISKSAMALRDSAGLKKLLGIPSLDYEQAYHNYYTKKYASANRYIAFIQKKLEDAGIIDEIDENHAGTIDVNKCDNGNCNEIPADDKDSDDIRAGDNIDTTDIDTHTPDDVGINNITPSYIRRAQELLFDGEDIDIGGVDIEDNVTMYTRFDGDEEIFIDTKNRCKYIKDFYLTFTGSAFTQSSNMLVVWMSMMVQNLRQCITREQCMRKAKEINVTSSNMIEAIHKFTKGDVYFDFIKSENPRRSAEEYIKSIYTEVTVEEITKFLDEARRARTSDNTSLEDFVNTDNILEAAGILYGTWYGRDGMVFVKALTSSDWSDNPVPRISEKLSILVTGKFRGLTVIEDIENFTKSSSTPGRWCPSNKILNGLIRRNHNSTVDWVELFPSKRDHIKKYIDKNYPMSIIDQ